MRFYTLEEKKPEYGEKVLAKINSEEEEFDYYYVVCRTTKSIGELKRFMKKLWVSNMLTGKRKKLLAGLLLMKFKKQKSGKEMRIKK